MSFRFSFDGENGSVREESVSSTVFVWTLYGPEGGGSWIPAARVDGTRRRSWRKERRGGIVMGVACYSSC